MASAPWTPTASMACRIGKDTPSTPPAICPCSATRVQATTTGRECTLAAACPLTTDEATANCDHRKCGNHPEVPVFATWNPVTEAEDFAGIGDFPRALTARFPPLASDALPPNLSACVVAYSLANGSWWRETWSLAASGAGATGEVQVRVEARGDVDVAYCPRKLVLDLFRSAARPEEEEQQGEELLRVHLGDVHASALKGEDAGVVCAAAPAEGLRVLGGGRGVRGGLSVDGRACGREQILMSGSAGGEGRSRGREGELGGSVEVAVCCRVEMGPLRTYADTGTAGAEVRAVCIESCCTCHVSCCNNTGATGAEVDGQG